MNNNGHKQHRHRACRSAHSTLIVMLSMSAAALLAACGSSSSTRSASASKPPAVSTRTNATSTAAASTTAAATTIPPSGSVLLTVSQANDVCASAFGQGWQTLDDLHGGHLLPGGRVALLCAPQQSAQSQGPSPEAYAVYDLIGRDVVWQADLTNLATDPQNGPDAFFGMDHLFLISQKTTPAQGLQSASTAYTLTARDLITGATDWSTAIGTEDPTVGLNVSEGVSGIPAHPQTVVLSYPDGTSAYDASTGARLWHTANGYLTPASGSYVTAGVVEIDGYQDNDYNQHLTGFDAATDRQVWDLHFPSSCQPDTDGQYLVGDVEWEFSSSCFEEHNVATGALLAERQFPSSWQNVEATPGGVAEWDGTNLAFYTTSNLKTPVWSVPSGQTTPQAISGAHMLVDAPSGSLVLDNSSGAITAHVPASFDTSSLTPQGNGGPVVDGLVESIAEDGDTAVLELDPPKLPPR